MQPTEFTASHIARRAFLLWGLGACMATAHGQKGRGKIVMATAHASPGSITGTWLALVYREAFARLGYDFELMVLPLKRGELLSTYGDVDGDLHRVQQYGDTHPTLVQVPTSHFSDSFVAYGLPGTLLEDGWDALKDTSLRVDYRGGAIRVEKMLTGRVPPAQLQIVISDASGFRKLLKGRSDVFVMLESTAIQAFKETEFRGVPIRKIAVMEVADYFAYLHLKNRALAAPLAATLDMMRKEGTIEKFREQAIALEAMNARSR